MKKARIIVMVLVAVVLAAGTVFERYRGAEWVADHFYGSWWFAVLLGLVAVGSLSRVYTLIRSKLIRSHIPSLLIHIAIPVILLGGALTSWTGEHYSITLAPGETKEGITLERFEVLYYPGTRTPMDFVSHVTVADGSAVSKADISMNHILRYDGRRYYQEDYDDQGRTTLSVSHDPWGIPVSYTGYALLLLGLGGLVLKRSERGVNKGSERGVKGTIASADNIADKNICPPHSSFTPSSLPSHSLSLLLLLFLPLSSFAAPKTLPRETASKMGEMYTLYKGRICPLQTFAKDFTTKLTGKATYEGLSSEQVLSGFIFYYSDWAPILDEVSPKRQKESRALVEMLLSGRSLKLFPVADSTGTLGWYAQNDDLPMTVSDDEYIFIRKHLSYCQELVVKGDFATLEKVFEKIKLFQEKRAADVLPSPTRVKAERLYNALTTGRWLAMLTLTLGILLFAYSLYTTTHKRSEKFSIFLFHFSILYLILLTSYLLLIFILRWIAGGHIPMAGGFDSMNLMAIAIGILGLVFSFRSKKFSISAAMLSMGFCLLVAMMSGSNPPVTNLMPVLSSPLLCLHVAVIMMSYALFFFLMIIGIAGLISGKKTFNFQSSIFNLAKRLLYPAVFLLTLGIIIGALWANISWGNYWTWDPKEVWALITLIVYAFPLHPSLSVSREPKKFFLYCTLAFLSVIITYFGVNILLGGMHSYGG
jgi:ABC-type transport system involved in cytochrome c biogenesis permease subunit